MLSSHNLSCAAWGKLQKQGSQLHIMHYEVSRQRVGIAQMQAKLAQHVDKQEPIDMAVRQRACV